MKFKIFSVIDYVLLSCVVLLIGFGIAFVYSSAIDSEGILLSNEYLKQIVWALLGFVLLLGLALYDYRLIERYISWVFIGLLVILVYTRLFGRYVNGAKSWIGIGEIGIQPSEFGKIIFILFFAHFLKTSEKESPRRRFFKAIGFFIVPTGLILLQPDLGTATVFIPIFFFMCFAAGIKLRYIMFLLLSGALTILFTMLPVWQSQIAQVTVPILNILVEPRLRIIITSGVLAITIIGILGKLFYKNNVYYYWIAYAFTIIFLSLVFSYLAGKVLKEYQLKRLIIFMNPDSDRLGAGWNIIQSKIAIGAGGFFGRGFLHGTQSHYRFLPQQSTDFIFSILSEELGFIGGFFVFILYMIMMLEMINIFRKSNNTFGSYIAAGILGMFFFHFIVNVGMVMGIMPITGIPLFFLSYGGSSLWTAMASIGLLMSINYRHHDFMDLIGQ